MKQKIEWYREVLAVEPGSKVFFSLARLEAEAGLFDDAVTTLRRGLSYHPDHTEARLLLIDLLFESGRQSELLQEMEDISKILSAYPGFWSAWGEYLAHDQQMNDAGIALRFLAASLQGYDLSWSQVISLGINHILEESGQAAPQYAQPAQPMQPVQAAKPPQPAQTVPQAQTRPAQTAQPVQPARPSDQNRRTAEPAPRPAVAQPAPARPAPAQVAPARPVPVQPAQVVEAEARPAAPARPAHAPEEGRVRVVLKPQPATRAAKAAYEEDEDLAEDFAEALPEAAVTEARQALRNSALAQEAGASFEEDDNNEEPFSTRTRSMADILAEQGDYNGALEIYNELLSSSPSAGDRAELTERIAETRRLASAPQEPVQESGSDKELPRKNRLMDVLESLAQRLEARV